MPQHSQSTLRPEHQEGMGSCPLIITFHDTGSRTRGRVPADACHREIPCNTLFHQRRPDRQLDTGYQHRPDDNSESQLACLKRLQLGYPATRYTYQ